MPCKHTWNEETLPVCLQKNNYYASSSITVIEFFQTTNDHRTPHHTPLCEVISLFSSSYLHVQVWISNYEFATKNSTMVELLWIFLQRFQGRSHSVITRTKPTRLKQLSTSTPNAGPSIIYVHVTTIKLIIWWSHVLSLTFFKHNFSPLRTSIIRKKCVAVTDDIPVNNNPVSGSTALNCQLKKWWGRACRFLHRQHLMSCWKPNLSIGIFGSYVEENLGFVSDLGWRGWHLAC